MVRRLPTTLVPKPRRSSVLVIVMVLLLFTAAALTAFVEKAGNDLLVDVHEVAAKRLRKDAFSALEVTLAVLEDFREADSGLHSPAEGWGDPLAWAGWEPGEGRTVEITFHDESAKIPLAHADMTTLTNLFEAWQMPAANAEKLSDALLGWMSQGYVYASTLAPDYDQDEVPYAEPQRPLRSFGELSAVAYARDIFFDEKGRPNEFYWRFADDVSLYNFPQPNVNGANPDVLAAVGQYTSDQQKHISDYLSGAGQFAQQGKQWIQNTSMLGAVAGAGGNANPFSTTIAALRIDILVKEGSTEYHLSAVVSPQGGAKLNTTVATNSTATTSTKAASASTSLTNTAQPSSAATTAATAAAASKSIKYPFTLLELVEEDEVPKPPIVATPST